jgi:hypothetical protein
MNAVTPLTTAGGALSGPLFSATLLPSAPLELVSREYVDSVLATTPTLVEFDALRDEVRQLQGALFALANATKPAASPAPAPRLVTHDVSDLVYTAPYFVPVPFDSLSSGFLPIVGGTLSGRLIVRTAAVPSVVVYDTVGNTASGMWEAGGDLWIGATDGTGNPTASYARWNAAQLLVQGEVRAMGFPDFGLTASAGIREFQFNAQCLFYFDDASGDLSWLNSAGVNWIMRASGTCEAVQGPVAGAGPYDDTTATPAQQLHVRVATLEAEVAALKSGGATLPARKA